ncbi:hypothetical protein E2320_014507, partial [Naja naja]
MVIETLIKKLILNIKSNGVESKAPIGKVFVTTALWDLNVDMAYSYITHQHILDSQFYNASIDGIYLDENGELAADLDIVNWVKFSNKSVVNVKFGSIARQGSSEPLFKIDNEAIIWPKWLNQIHCKMLNAKCPLTLERDETDPLNYFKPGDYLITGITPVTTTMFRPFTFKKAPTNKVI